MTLKEIGQEHLAWKMRNFGSTVDDLTDALVLCEEAGEVAKVVVKTHHGIRAHDRGDLAEELADVVLVATGMAVRCGIDLDAAVAAKAAKRDKKDFRARPTTG